MAEGFDAEDFLPGAFDATLAARFMPQEREVLRRLADGR